MHSLQYKIQDLFSSTMRDWAWTLVGRPTIGNKYCRVLYTLRVFPQSVRTYKLYATKGGGARCSIRTATAKPKMDAAPFSSHYVPGGLILRAPRRTANFSDALPQHSYCTTDGTAVPYMQSKKPCLPSVRSDKTPPSAAGTPCRVDRDPPRMALAGALSFFLPA